MGPEKQVIPKQNTQTVLLTNTTTGATEIPFAEMKTSGYIVTNLTTAATFSFWVGDRQTNYTDDPAGGKTSPTLGLLKDSANATITQAVTSGGAYTLPTQAQGFGVIIIVTDAGTAAIKISRKSI